MLTPHPATSGKITNTASDTDATAEIRGVEEIVATAIGAGEGLECVAATAFGEVGGEVDVFTRVSDGVVSRFG